MGCDDIAQKFSTTEDVWTRLIAAHPTWKPWNANPVKCVKEMCFAFEGLQLVTKPTALTLSSKLLVLSSSETTVVLSLKRSEIVSKKWQMSVEMKTAKPTHRA